MGSQDKAKWWSHALDVYDVHLEMARTPKEYRALRREIVTAHPLNPDDAGRTSSHLWESDTERRFHVVFWLDGEWCETRTTAQVVNLCAHEATHGVGMLIGHMGADTEDFVPDGEPLAYLTAWVTEWLFRGVTR